MDSSVRVSASEDIREGELQRFTTGQLDLMVPRVGGRVYAVEDRCGHTSAPLSLGTLEGTSVDCPLHHACFDITTGALLSDPVINLPADATNVRVRSFGLTRTYLVRAYEVEERDGDGTITLP